MCEFTFTVKSEVYEEADLLSQERFVIQKQLLAQMTNTIQHATRMRCQLCALAIFMNVNLLQAQLDKSVSPDNCLFIRSHYNLKMFLLPQLCISGLSYYTTVLLKQLETDLCHHASCYGTKKQLLLPQYVTLRFVVLFLVTLS